MRWLLFIFLVSSVSLQAQIGIGTNTPDPSSALEVANVDSLNPKGLLIPRLTTVERDASGTPIGDSPATGLMIYNIDVKCIQVNIGTPDVALWRCIEVD